VAWWVLELRLERVAAVSCRLVVAFAEATTARCQTAASQRVLALASVLPTHNWRPARRARGRAGAQARTVARDAYCIASTAQPPRVRAHAHATGRPPSEMRLVPVRYLAILRSREEIVHIMSCNSELRSRVWAAPRAARWPPLNQTRSMSMCGVRPHGAPAPCDPGGLLAGRKLNYECKHGPGPARLAPTVVGGSAHASYGLTIQYVSETPGQWWPRPH
jgi:hypothetical protein